MQQHLYKFLVLHHKLSIPQLGSFTIDKEPARFDAPSGLLFAPKPVIHFGETTEPIPDKILFDFLSAEMGVDEVTAAKEFNDFSYQFRTNIQQHSLGLMPGIGRIARGADGNLSFTPESNLLELLPPIQLQDASRMPRDTVRVTSKKTIRQPSPEPPLPQVSTNETVKEETVKEVTVKEVIVEEEIDEEEIIETYNDRWWIYAILLLVTGLGALLFYYQ